MCIKRKRGKSVLKKVRDSLKNLKKSDQKQILSQYQMLPLTSNIFEFIQIILIILNYKLKIIKIINWYQLNEIK